MEIDHAGGAEDDYVPGDATDFTMKYRVLFEPLKVYSTTVEMIVSCKDRGRWKVTTTWTIIPYPNLTSI